MIFSLGLKSAAPGVGSLRTLSELTEENSCDFAEFPDQRLSAFESSPTLSKADAEQLATCILQRIESRLPCRIRNLRVSIAENAVVLEGQCSTYYSKQIAQHTAMGVLEYERLTNHIEVCTAK